MANVLCNAVAGTQKYFVDYFKDVKGLGEDVVRLAKNTSKDDSAKEKTRILERVGSLALSTLGTAIVLGGVFLAFSAITVASTPLAVFIVASAITAFAIGHDMMVVGAEQREAQRANGTAQNLATLSPNLYLLGLFA